MGRESKNSHKSDLIAMDDDGYAARKQYSAEDRIRIVLKGLRDKDGMDVRPTMKSECLSGVFVPRYIHSTENYVEPRTDF